MTASVRGLLMIRPARFGFNPETADSNSFQQRASSDIHDYALAEFNAAMDVIKSCGVPVTVYDDDRSNPLPDSIFPNNWFSTHGDSVVLYPMMAINRRAERRQDIINDLIRNFGYRTIHNFTEYEHQGKFLEGTGSIVFDHSQKIAFAAISPRTDKDILLEACEKTGYLPVVFHSNDRNGSPVYHTNVVMALSENIAVCCFSSINDSSDREGIRNYFTKTGRNILDITMEQMESFCGNLLFFSYGMDNFAAISETAWNSFSVTQQNLLKTYAKPLIVSIPHIERHGGGGIRCMLAELF